MNAMYSKSNSMLKLSTSIAAGRNLAFFLSKQQFPGQDSVFQVGRI